MIEDIVKSILLIAVVLTIVPVLIWWERKGSAYIQDRRGPNRANILGVRLGGFILNIADAVKLFFKEDIVPRGVNRFIYILSPAVIFFTALAVSAIIPFSSPLNIGDHVITTSVVNLNVGILYALAIGSLGVYGVLLAGWSSGSSYPLFGGLRAAAQMISYEVAMGLALIGVLMWNGTFCLDEIVAIQGANICQWNIVYQPVSFILFLISIFAETNRNPFDLPEGESELVGGYHTEYSSMKFALFFMAEYAQIIVGSMLIVTLFLGGWQIPFLPTDLLIRKMPQILRYGVPVLSIIFIACGAVLFPLKGRFGWKDKRDLEPFYFGLIFITAGVVFIGLSLSGIFDVPSDSTFIIIVTSLTQAGVFLIKVLLFCWFFIWVRWTLPRFRYDQLMKLGWRVMVPLAAANIVMTGIFMIWRR